MSNKKNQKFIDPLVVVLKHPRYKGKSRDIKELLIFGDTVYHKRKELKLSQEKLSRETGISQRIISNIEHGNYNPGLSTILKIARLLYIDISKKYGLIDNERIDEISRRVREVFAEGSLSPTQLGSDKLEDGVLSKPIFERENFETSISVDKSK